MLGVAAASLRASCAGGARATRSTSTACTGRAGSCARSRRRCRSTASRASTPWPGRCSGCSASWRCTCRPRAAAPRARSCSTRSGAEAVERLREAVRARRPEVADDAPAGRDLPERRLSRRDGLIAALTAGQLGVILPVAGGRVRSSSPTSSSDERGVEEASRLVPDTLGGWELAIGALLLAGVGALGGGVAGGVRGLHGHARRRAAADPARAAAAHRGGAAGAARARRARGRGPAAAPVRALRRCGSRSPATPTRRPPRARCSRSCGAAEVEPFLAELLPELADDPGGLAPPPRARRAPLRAAEDALAGAGRGRRAPASSSPPIAPWPLLLAPLLALDGWLDYRAAGWRLRDGRLAMRSRRLAWSTLLDARRAAAAARDRAEPAAAPRPARRPRGGGRQGRPRAGPPPRAPVAAELWERLRR